MFNLGPMELVIILVIIVIIFGVGKLPELGSGLGEGIRNFRRSYRDSKTLDVTPESTSCSLEERAEVADSEKGNNEDS